MRPERLLQWVVMFTFMYVIWDLPTVQYFVAFGLFFANELLVRMEA